MAHPRGVAERQRERLAQYRQHADDRERGGESGGGTIVSARRSRRHNREVRFNRDIAEHTDELWMKRFVDALNDCRGDRVETGGASDLVRDAAKQPLRVVA